MAALLVAGAAGAGAPETSLRPEPRPAQPEATGAALTPVAEAPGRPQARPEDLAAGAETASVAGPPVPPAMDPEVSALAVAAAVRPLARPDGIATGAEVLRGASAEGQVCGNPLIQGETVAAVSDQGGCGIGAPVRVRSVDGVALSEEALMDCGTAQALLEWVQRGARPAVGSRGGGLAGLKVMGHYVCRSRNNRPGARMSEHGLGRAIDIGAVVLRDGSRLSIAGDWPDPALTAMHEAACGIFSTTLGPRSDGYHEDHLHYDTASRRSGPYCR